MATDIFSPENLRKSAAKTFSDATAALPPDAKMAVLIDATGNQVSAVLVSKLVKKDKFEWSVLSEATYDGHHVEGHVATALVWK